MKALSTKAFVFACFCLWILCIVSAESQSLEEGSFRKSDLVELIKLDPNLRLEIRYATTNNFTAHIVYPEARAFLQRPVAEALIRANQNVHKLGFGLAIFDGYRPLSVVKYFWDVTELKNKKFVADPSRGSTHSRGCAVDLTLFDLKTGKLVDMPSEYDEWSDRSASDYPGGTEHPRNMRDILRSAMEKEGFIPAPAEWWHYTYKDWEEYQNMDIPFSQIP